MTYNLKASQIDCLVNRDYSSVVKHLPNVQAVNIEFVVPRLPSKFSTLLETLIIPETKEVYLHFLFPIFGWVTRLSETLRTVPRDLEKLELHLRSGDAPNIELASASIVEAHPNLRALRFPVTAIGLGTLSGLEHLTSLNLVFHEDVEFSWIAPDALSSLLDLSVDGALPSIISLFTHIHSPILSTLVTAIKSGTEDMLEEMVDILPKFPSLRSFELIGESARPPGWDSLIRPLTRSHGLRRVVLWPAEPAVFIDDERLRFMASSWPYLEELRLLGSSYSSPFLPTLLGLQVLPKTLRRLEISIDADLDDAQLLEQEFPNM